MKMRGDTLPIHDEQFEAMAHVERRRLLVALLGESSGADTPIEIDEVGDGTESLEWRAAMRHNHLPRLEDHGFICWDREYDLVSRGPQFEAIEPLLAHVNENRNELPGDRS